MSIGNHIADLGLMPDSLLPLAIAGEKEINARLIGVSIRYQDSIGCKK